MKLMRCEIVVKAWDGSALRDMTVQGYKHPGGVFAVHAAIENRRGELVQKTRGDNWVTHLPSGLAVSPSGFRSRARAEAFLEELLGVAGMDWSLERPLNAPGYTPEAREEIREIRSRYRHLEEGK